MSDVRAEPLPEQPSPSPDRTHSAATPDPLAGDWSEGLPGPVRAHGLPIPARLGEERVEAAPAPEAPSGPPAPDPGWSMAPPVPQTATEPAWTPHAHDAGFSPITRTSTFEMLRWSKTGLSLWIEWLTTTVRSPRGVS